MGIRSFWKNSVLNFYDGRLDTTWKNSLWADCPLLAIRSNPEVGIIVEEDFVKFPLITDADPPTLNGWTCTQGGNTKGKLALITGKGGLLEVDSESTTQHEGWQGFMVRGKSTGN